MNIIIKNANASILDSLNIEIIKTLAGEFFVEDVHEQLTNLYYSKIIIDVTAIRNYTDTNSAIAFLKGFDPMHVVLLISKNKGSCCSDFLKEAVQIGIYNFATNVDEILYLLNNPNTYEKAVECCTVIEKEESKKSIGNLFKKLFNKKS